LKNKHLIGICRKLGGQDQSKPKKGPFSRKQENVAEHIVRLRGWWKTQSHGDASQMLYVPNGTKG
jgi:hypothetical protein